ncbi:MAG: DNA primase, partial [Acidipropionibacterium jensenii]|nr:DNA primase [Acidipropionibacterium jensenii]
PAAPSMPWPDPADRRLAAERGLLKLLLQRPDLFDADWDLVEPADFRHPAYRAVFEAATSVPVVPEGWSQAVSEATSDPIVRQLEVALLVEPVLSAEPDARYAAAYAARVRLLSVTDDIADLKSRLQRTNPTTDRGAYNAMFADLVELEALRKELISAGSGSIEVQ